jgi:hypothetical protein
LIEMSLTDCLCSQKICYFEGLCEVICKHPVYWLISDQ